MFGGVGLVAEEVFGGVGLVAEKVFGGVSEKGFGR